MTQLLEIMNYTLLLSFGSIVSVSFAGYEKTVRNRKAILLLVLLILSLQLTSYFMAGLAVTARLYPLITHVPNVLFIEHFMKKPRSIAIVSVLTAYLCCQPPNWFGVSMGFLWNNTVAFHIGYSLGLLIMFYLINRFVASSVNQVISYSHRSLFLFGSFPLLYYVFDYTTTIYTGFLYSGAKIVVEFFPSVLSMFYIIFIIAYCNEMQKRNRLKLDNLMLETKFEHAANVIFTLQQVQNQTAIYRHDMRHHLALLYSFLKAGEPEKAMEYIRQTQNEIDSITPVRYCENITINLILSAFATKAEQKGVALNIDAVVPESLPFPDTEICTLLANGLENAVAAAASGSESDRESNPPIVRINCHVHKNNLLMLIENTLYGQAEIKNGLPYTHKEGHGFGVKSIAMLVDRHKGYYSYSVNEGVFILKIVLPMVEY